MLARGFVVKAQPFEACIRIDRVDDDRLFCDDLGQTAGRDDARRRCPEFGADPGDERLGLADEAVDDAGLQGGDRIAADRPAAPRARPAETSLFVRPVRRSRSGSPARSQRRDIRRPPRSP